MLTSSPRHAGGPGSSHPLLPACPYPIVRGRFPRSHARKPGGHTVNQSPFQTLTECFFLITRRVSSLGRISCSCDGTEKRGAAGGEKATEQRAGISHSWHSCLGRRLQNSPAGGTGHPRVAASATCAPTLRRRCSPSLPGLASGQAGPPLHGHQVLR